MTAQRFWREGALPAAMGSLGSLLAQALMALFLLRLYTPAAVGQFSVVAQVAFGWATLALAQSPLTLLANQHESAVAAGRRAWQLSAWRWLWLMPVAVLAVWWSLQPTAKGGTMALGVQLSLWAAAIALAQLSWLLAQSLALRIHAPLSVAAVRALPPMLAAAAAALAAGLWPVQDGQLLLAAALLGYALGASWLWPLLRPSEDPTPAALASHDGQTARGDDRSEALKFVHTLSDVLVAAALATHWARVHGAAQAGCLLILLRVMGFVPALVSTAWAQVVLSRPLQQRPPSWLAALAAGCGIGLLGLGIALALSQGWLSPAWQGLAEMLWPVALWQSAASLMASVSHRPLRFGQAHAHTWQCLVINAVQTLLVWVPPWWGSTPLAHLWLLSVWMTLALGLQALWAMRLRP